MAKRTPSGKFRGKVTIGYDPDGKPIYKYVTAPTRRELENVKEAVREHYIFGRAIPRDQPFYEYAGQWYRIKKEPFIFIPARRFSRRCFLQSGNRRTPMYSTRRRARRSRRPATSACGRG